MRRKSPRWNGLSKHKTDGGTPIDWKTAEAICGFRVGHRRAYFEKGGKVMVTDFFCCGVESAAYTFDGIQERMGRDNRSTRLGY